MNIRLLYSYSDLLQHVVNGFVLVFIAFSSVGLSVAGDIDSLRDRFLTDAPKKEAEYSLFAERLQGSISTTLTIVDPAGKTKTHIRSKKQIKQGEHGVSFLHQSYDGDKTNVDDNRTFGCVYAVNSVYAFEIKRGNSKQDWLLEHLYLPGKGKETLFEGLPIRDMLFSWTGPMFDVYGRRVCALTKEKTFRVTRASKVNRDGHDLAQIDFICPHPIPENTAPYFVQGGSLWLDPDHYWCIQEYDLKTQSIDGAGTMREHLEFKEGTNQRPIITRVVRTGKSPLGNSSEEIFESDFHEVSKLHPDEEFTLSAFGLPEPMGVKLPPPSRTWLWLLAAALAAMGMALLFAWLKRRHAKAHLPAS